MCGRYAASRSPEDLIVEYEAVDGTAGARLPADYNVTPTAAGQAIRTRVTAGIRELTVLRWGLVEGLELRPVGPAAGNVAKSGQELLKRRDEPVPAAHTLL